MKKIFYLVLLTIVCLSFTSIAQTTGEPTPKRVYNESINPLEQIDQALIQARAEGKFVICQVGGNWCPWCLRFAEFITGDSAINAVIEQNFVYIHANYNPRKAGEVGEALMQRLNNAGRFGFPVLVVLDEQGNVIHIQDSALLEEGKGYNQPAKGATLFPELDTCCRAWIVIRQEDDDKTCFDITFNGFVSTLMLALTT